jgi:hypothetical protein
MDEFLAVAEVAEILKLNQQTVRNRIDQPTPSRPRSRSALTLSRSHPPRRVTLPRFM